MNKKILIISILAAVLMILLPMSSVIGTNVVRENARKGGLIHLFLHREYVVLQNKILKR